MKFYAATGLAVVMAAATAFAQSAKPNPYQGVSHPPTDAIVTNDLGTTTNATGVDNSGNLPSYQPAAHMETMSSSPYTQSSAQHPGLMSRPSTQAYGASPSTGIDADIVTNVPSAPNQLPEGTAITVALNQQLSTATTMPGAIFSARVVQPVMKNGRIVIPVGSVLSGRVTSVYSGRRITGGAAIHLRPDEVNLPDGTRYFLHAEVYDMGNPSKVKPDSEGNVVAVAHGKRTLAEAGLFGGGAAATGFLIAGGPAAWAAGGAAAGYVGVHWLFENKQAILPMNSEVVFGLTQPMTLVSFHE